MMIEIFTSLHADEGRGQPYPSFRKLNDNKTLVTKLRTITWREYLVDLVDDDVPCGSRICVFI